MCILKTSLLDHILCPETKEELELKVFEKIEDQIISGALISKESGLSYPIINGVPRLLPVRLRENLTSTYPDFYSKYKDEFKFKETEIDSVTKVQAHTQEAFGHEWTWAADYDADNFESWLPDGLDKDYLFKDKVGLEVGCGAGRHAQKVSSYSKIHIAVDLSHAVDSAHERTKEIENCHVVQADAFSLPFRENNFDYVYCLGVLQHMHNPPAGFEALSKIPKKDGYLLINVYQKGRPITVGALELVRKVTTNLSNRQLEVISTIAGYVEYYVFFFPWVCLRNTAVGKILKPIVPKRIDEYAKHDLKTAIVDWFDRLSCPVKIHYRKEDLEKWYQEQGYRNILVTPYWKAFWNGFGIKS